MNITFTYGEFIFEVLGTHCALKTPILGVEYSGKAIIPSIAMNGVKKYIVTALSDSCFGYCIGLTAIAFPETLKIIRPNSLYNTSVTSLFIPKSVTEICNAAFSGAFYLETVIFEPGIKLITIDKVCFAWCYQLKMIILPPSIKSIGDRMFQGTSSVISFYYCGSNELNNEKMFKSSVSDVVVNPYVTKRYPSQSKIGGKDAEIIEDEKCVPYYEIFNNKMTCKKTRRALSFNIFITMLMII